MKTNAKEDVNRNENKARSKKKNVSNIKVEFSMLVKRVRAGGEMNFHLCGKESLLFFSSSCRIIYRCMYLKHAVRITIYEVWLRA